MEQTRRRQCDRRRTGADRGKSLTDPRDAELAAVLAACDTLRADGFTRFCAVLTAYAESDFDPAAVQHGRTFGVFQQDPRFWPTAHSATYDQALAFLTAFIDNRPRLVDDDPVCACWVTQRWLVPAPAWPDPGPGWRESVETQNYVRRVGEIDAMIANPRYFQEVS